MQTGAAGMKKNSLPNSLRRHYPDQVVGMISDFDVLTKTPRENVAKVENSKKIR